MFPAKNLLSCARRFHRASILKIDAKNVEEVRIPVPWGHIAGKRWGTENSQPIIALHGLFDNCGTFDKLLPLLNSPVIALDLPGHGQSSHMPEGILYNYLDNLTWLRYLITKYFKIDNPSFIGHSFGSSLAFCYVSLFSDSNKFISIDCARFAISPSPDTNLKRVRDGINAIFEPKKIPNELPYDELYKNFVNKRASIPAIVMDDNSYAYIFKRGIKQVKYGFIETLDPRLNANRYIGVPTIEYLDELGKKIKCDFLSIISTKGLYVGDRKIEYDKQISVMKKNCKLTELVVEGGHHVHLDNPELLAKHINDFLS